MNSLTKVLLFILVALGSLWASFFVVETESLHYVIIYLSYPNLALTFLLFAFGLTLTFRKEKQIPQKFLSLVKKPWALLTILGLTALFLIYEPFEFKIVNDELILSTTAQMMHFDSLGGMPRVANDLSGSFELLESTLDKRPLVFPFLLSLAHDLLGYRYQNVFILNAVLTFILMALIYVVGRIFSGHRGGMLSILLAGTLPLLSIYTTSGHFEILNLVMLCTVLITSYLYLRQPDEYRIVALVYSLIILSQVRYENSLYVLVFGVLILVGWRKADRILLPWPVIISPAFFILYAMHYRMILNNSTVAFQEGPNGRIDTFSLSYAPENLSSAVSYMFSIGQHNSNSYLLSLMGVVSIFFFCLHALRKPTQMNGQNPRNTVAFFLLLSIFAFSLVIVFFNFGMFNEYVTNRLSLPLYLLFILMIPFILRRYSKNYLMTCLLAGLACAAIAMHFMTREEILRKGTLFGVATVAFAALAYVICRKGNYRMQPVLYIPVLYILLVTMPIAHPHRYSQGYRSNDIVLNELAFLEQQKDEERILWVASSPYAGVLMNVSSHSLPKMRRYPGNMLIHLNHRNFNSIYITRLFEPNEDNEFIVKEQEDALDENIFKLETVYERSIRGGTILRIDRLTDIVLPPEAAHSKAI